MTARQAAVGALAAICTIALCCCSGTGAAPDAGGPPLRLMTYNIKHAGLSSLAAIASVINAQHPDVVALQEVDNGTTRTGQVDQAAMLGQLTGLHERYTPITPWEGGTVGIALLSRFPIASAHDYMLTSNEEPRALTIASLQVAHHQLTIAYTHFNLIPADRVVEAQEVLDHTAGISNLVLMGDLNDIPTAPSVKKLTARFSDAWAEAGGGPGYTDPSSMPDRRIDFILPGPAWPSASGAAVIHSRDSDHDPVVVELPWP